MWRQLPALTLILLLAAPAWAIEIDVDSNDAVDVTSGGTNARTAAQARANLGAQAASPRLDYWATISPTTFGASLLSIASAEELGSLLGTGTEFTACDNDGDIWVWDVDTGEPVCATPVEVTAGSGISILDGVISVPVLGLPALEGDTLLYHSGAWTVSPGGSGAAAVNVTVQDAFNYFVSSHVEGALAELGAAIAQIQVGVAQVDPPNYSDSPCTTGTYSFHGGYAYFCIATDTWDRVALASWNNPTPGDLYLVSATVPTAGDEVSLLLSAAATIGAGGNGGWTMTCASGALTMTYSSGDGTDTLVYTLSDTAAWEEVCTLDYTQPGDGIEDGSGTDLASLADYTVLNNSLVGYDPGGGGAAISDDFADDSSADYLNISRGITVTSGHAEGGGTGYQPSAVLHSIDLASANHYVQGRLIVSVAVPRYKSGLILRADPGADATTETTGYFIDLDDSGANLYRFSASNLGAPTWVNRWNFSGTWADGDDYLVKVEVTDQNRFYLYVDWNDDGDFEDANESLGYLSDTTYYGSYVGMNWSNIDGTEAWVDDLEADAL